MKRILDETKVKQLANREIFLSYNPDNDDVRDLSTILREAFPDYNASIFGTRKIYGAVEYNKSHWVFYRTPPGPLVPLKDFFIEEYEGQLKGFPKYVVDAMLDEQEKQGNRRDVTIFENSPYALKVKGGFDWLDKKKFWRDIIAKKQFHLLKPKTEIMERFPFKLTEENAKRIIAIACKSTCSSIGWKDKLAGLWGKELLLMGYVSVSKEFYQEMRAACTLEQHKLFDEIFGKDEIFLAEGTPCLVRDNDGSYWHFARADGKGMFKAREAVVSDNWKHYQILDINNLPTD